MKKIIWALGICMAILFTGCGMPDAVADEVKVASRVAGFSSGDEEDSAERFREVYAATEAYEEKVKQSDRIAGYLDALAAFLEKEVTEGRISIGDYVADEEEDIEDDTESDLNDNPVSSQTNISDPEDYLMSDLNDLKNWRDFTPESQEFLGGSFPLSANFYIESSRMQDFLQGLGKIGFKGISLPVGEENLDSSSISQGVQFDIEEVRGYYHVSLQVLSNDFAYPEKYTDFLENHMRNAFSTTEIMCGGDLEYIVFQGSTSVAENNYVKKVETYFKNDKVLQMNLMIQPNELNEGSFFTEEEEKDLIGLFAWITGDEEGAESFIDGLKENNGKEGTLGNRHWYQSRNRRSGEVLVRIQ